MRLLALINHQPPWNEFTVLPLLSVLFRGTVWVGWNGVSEARLGALCRWIPGLKPDCPQAWRRRRKDANVYCLPLSRVTSKEIWRKSLQAMHGSSHRC